MKELNIGTGISEFSLNGNISVFFNPTDSEFAERICDAFEIMDKNQEKYREQLKKISGKKIFEFARQRDKEMREIIDGLFEAPVCDAIFGSMNVYAMSGGLPVWCNLMLAIMDEISEAFSREQKETDSRIAKYTAKYRHK